jgi:hypothetical protein
LFRANGKENGPVRCEISPYKGLTGALPECPDVPNLLKRMWQLKSLDRRNVDDGGFRVHDDPDEDPNMMTA